MNKKDRFIRSKCDRCGKATPARQNGEGDLFTLPHEWPSPLSDLGDFCQPCIGRHSAVNWLAWVAARYPELCVRFDMVAVRALCEAESD